MGAAGMGQILTATCYAGPSFTRKLRTPPMPKALKDHQKNTDLLIGGAGFAGLALAIALRQGLGEAFTPEVREAWTEAYLMAASVMRRAAARASGSYPKV